MLIMDNFIENETKQNREENSDISNQGFIKEILRNVESATFGVNPNRTCVKGEQE